MTNTGRRRHAQARQARLGLVAPPALAGLSVLLTVALVVLFVLAGGVDAPERREDEVSEADTAPESPTADPTTEATSEAPTPRATPSEAPAGFDRQAHSTTDPASPWVIVNKTNPLTPIDYEPELGTVHGQQVSVVAAEPLADLISTARAESVSLAVTSGFRSYQRQASVHSDLVSQHGREAAEALSARPGYSEHQTGLAVDVIDLGARRCDLNQCFADTPGGRWVAEHAWRLGWIVRYRSGHESTTGYTAEPWHLRYVGRELAAELRDRDYPPLELFFTVSGGDYSDNTDDSGSAGAG